MAVLRRKRGEKVYTTDALHVVVLAIRGTIVQFAVYDTKPDRAGAVLSSQMSEVCRNKFCYFWFPRGGCCTLVVQCGRGKSVWLEGANRLTVMDVRADSITVAITGQPATGQLTRKGQLTREQGTGIPAHTNSRRCTEISPGQHRAKLGERLAKRALRQAILGQFAALLAAVVRH